MPGNTTVGSTLLDEDFRRVLLEREQECLQLQAMNSTPPPGRIYYVRSCRNINSSQFSKLASLRIYQVEVSCDQSFRLRVRTRKIAEDRMQILARGFKVDSRIIEICRMQKCKWYVAPSQHSMLLFVFSYFFPFFFWSARYIFMFIWHVRESTARPSLHGMEGRETLIPKCCTFFKMHDRKSRDFSH